MKLWKHVMAGAGAPLALAAMLLAGAAGSHAVRPATAASDAVSDSITFNALVSAATSSFSLSSTTCTLTDIDSTTWSCGVSGSGKISSAPTGPFVIGSDITSTARLTIVGGFGPISIKLSGSGGCADGSGVALTAGGSVPVYAQATVTSVTQLTTHLFTIRGSITVINADGMIGC